MLGLIFGRGGGWSIYTGSLFSGFYGIPCLLLTIALLFIVVKGKFGQTLKSLNILWGWL